MECEEGAGPAWKRRGVWGRRVRRRLPALRWARGYSRLAAAEDAVAGLTLGLTLVPQSIAYAALADMPVQYGLYSAFIGPIVYALLGTVKEVSIGPTSLMALLTLQACRGQPPQLVALLAFLAGAVVTLMALLRLGFLVELISGSVTSGFTSATAVVIVVSQLKGALGLSFTADSVWDNVRHIVADVGHVRLADCALAASCGAALLLLRKLKDLKVGGARLQKALWLVSIGRNALVVLAASVLAYCTHDPRHPLLKLSGRVEPGFPAVSLPAFSLQQGNTTLGFPELAQQLAPSLLMLPVVMVVANIAIAKAFCPGGRVDASQEMLALGAANMAGALLGALPATGAFTRAALAHTSGVRTPASGLYAGAVTLMALVFLTEYFFFIPKACLSAVLICAVIFMIDFKIVVELWRSSKSELCVLVVTFVSSVSVSVEAGVAAGAAASLALLLRRLMAARACRAPRLCKTDVGSALVVRLPGALLYLNCGRGLRGAEEAVRRGAEGAVQRGVEGAPLLADCGALALLDHSGGQALERLSKKLEASGTNLVLFNASPEMLPKLQRLQLEPGALSLPSPAAALRALRPPPPRPPHPARPPHSSDFPLPHHTPEETDKLLPHTQQDTTSV